MTSVRYKFQFIVIFLILLCTILFGQLVRHPKWDYWQKLKELEQRNQNNETVKVSDLLSKDDCNLNLHATWTPKIFELINQVRVNPDSFAEHINKECNYTQYRHQMVWPKREPLRYNAQLEEASKWHSCYQSLEDDFDHVEADNSTPMVRATRFGFHGKAVGEVLTQGYADPYQVVASWVCSDTHRDVMFKCKVSLMGVAVAQSEYNIPYATAMVGCRSKRFCTCNGLLANGTNVVEEVKAKLRKLGLPI